jgi:hypothetical protein
MVRPSRSDEFVSVKVYYRDQSGVMRAIEGVFLVIRDNNPGVIVYTNPMKNKTGRIDLA